MANKLYEYKGKEYPVSYLLELLNLNSRTFYKYIKEGLTVEDIETLKNWGEYQYVLYEDDELGLPVFVGSNKECSDWLGCSVKTNTLTRAIHCSKTGERERVRDMRTGKMYKVDMFKTVDLLNA